MTANEYEGHWITLYPSGKKFHYLTPRADEIDIRDIAHALALTCRFGGHCREFYSVAQHSVLVAEQLHPHNMFRLAGLLHDAHEAYLHDVPRPIKQDIAGYRDIADGVQEAVNRKYNIPGAAWIFTALIKFMDNTLLATEARDLGVDTTDWLPLPASLEDKIVPWTWQDAEQSFLTAFELYGGKDG